MIFKTLQKVLFLASLPLVTMSSASLAASSTVVNSSKVALLSSQPIPLSTVSNKLCLNKAFNKKHLILTVKDGRYQDICDHFNRLSEDSQTQYRQYPDPPNPYRNRDPSSGQHRDPHSWQNPDFNRRTAEGRGQRAEGRR